MKQLMKRFVAALAATLLLASGAQAADIVIGSPNWVSVNGTAQRQECRAREQPPQIQSAS